MGDSSDRTAGRSVCEVDEDDMVCVDVETLRREGQKGQVTFTDEQSPFVFLPDPLIPLKQVQVWRSGLVKVGEIYPLVV